MNSTIILSTEEVKKMIASVLEISEKDIVKMQYSFAIKGKTEAEIAYKLSQLN